MKKKIILSFLTVTAGLTVYYFIRNIMTIISYVNDPKLFKVAIVFYLVGCLILLFVHAFLYVYCMDMKDKRFIVDDEEEWWKKWDRV